MSIRLLVCPVLKPPQRLTIYKMNKVVRFLDYWKKFITFEHKQKEAGAQQFPERSTSSVQNWN